MNMTILTAPRAKQGREFSSFLVIGPSTSRLQTTSRLTSHPSLLYSHTVPTTLWLNELPAVPQAQILCGSVICTSLSFAAWDAPLCSLPGLFLPALQIQARHHLPPQCSKGRWVSLPSFLAITSLIVSHWNELSAHYTLSILRTETIDLSP